MKRYETCRYMNMNRYRYKHMDMYTNHLRIHICLDMEVDMVKYPTSFLSFVSDYDYEKKWEFCTGTFPSIEKNRSPEF